MKKLLSSLVILSLLLAACSSEVQPEISEELETEEITEETESPETISEEVDEVIEEPEYEPLPSSRETTAVVVSSELEDTSSYGFAYNASNIFDLDYSTSWCADIENDEAPTLTISFSEPTTVDSIGIVPGFARDETIFFQNDRLKTVELIYDDQSTTKEINFNDNYEMQFFDLPSEITQTITLKITETYPGSKYEDICIAELDFWSDWVDTKDSDAAYNYYLQYKEAFALRPISIANVDILFYDSYPYRDQVPVTADDLLLSCGAIDSSRVKKVQPEYGEPHWEYYPNGDTSSEGEFAGAYDSQENSYYAWGGMTPVLTAQLSSSVDITDQFTIKWIEYGFEEWQTLGDEGTRLIVTDIQTVEPKECQDGSLYISGYSSLGGNIFHDHFIQVYYENRLLWSGNYNLAQ